MQQICLTRQLPSQCFKNYTFNLSNNTKIVLGIGLYIRRKGIVDFIELARRLPDYTFIWYGYSSLKAATSDVREAFKNLPKNIIFPGYGEKELIREALGGCDLYLFPTYEETEGIPLIEACAMKCNILVRDIPIWDGMVEDGVNVYKAKNIEEFTEKIKLILENESNTGLITRLEAFFDIVKVKI